MNKVDAKYVAEKHLARYMKMDGTTIFGLMENPVHFFEVYRDVEYQLEIGVIRESEGVFRVCVSVDDMMGWSAFAPLCTDDFRKVGDTHWDEGDRPIEEPKAERYAYATLHGEEVCDVTPDCALDALGRLEDVLWERDDREVYAVGYTHKSKREIARVEDDVEGEVIVNRKVYLPFGGSRGFLLKLNCPAALELTFLALDKFMSIRYGIFNQGFGEGFRGAIEGSPRGVFDDDVTVLRFMRQDPEHLTYKINTVGRREDAFYLDHFSYGEKAPKDLLGFRQAV